MTPPSSPNRIRSKQLPEGYRKLWLKCQAALLSTITSEQDRQPAPGQREEEGIEAKMSKSSLNAPRERSRTLNLEPLVSQEPRVTSGTA